MYLFYSVLLVAWGILLIPAFLYRAWRHNKYLPGLSQRLGRLPQILRSDNRPTLWFHSCSVGETLSLEPLARTLHQRFPEARFVFSTITKTGQQVAVQRFATFGEGNAFYFPIDFAFVARRVLDWIQPAMMIIIDTEIWPNILHQAHLRGIPVVLANGRISAASFRYYRWARPILGRVFRNYATLMMQSEEDALRIGKMGAPAEKILVTGNIKFDKDLAGKDAGKSLERSLAQNLGLDQTSAPLIVAGSTHPGEEQILLEVLRRIRDLPEMEGIRMLLAPRHPERFDAVARLAEQSGFRVRRRTDSAGPAHGVEVILLDTVGELAVAYRFATIVFVGGTLVRHGGHSIMEPALYSKPIVIGPSMENFRQILKEFCLQKGLLQIRAGEEDKNLQVQQLMDVFVRLLHNSKEREDLGAAAFSILKRNRGATQRTAEGIAAIFMEAQTREPAQESKT
jgi:3-deoxy-D-manno-octulosonic-acid transferase